MRILGITKYFFPNGKALESGEKLGNKAYAKTLRSIAQEGISVFYRGRIAVDIIETVGSGQAEVRCAAIADRIVVVEGPARGDGVQAEKAGLLELADAVIVNKSDLDGAEKHAEELIESFHLGLGDAPPVLLTSALNGDGIDAASSTLLELKDSGRSNRARWRERLLAQHERRILESDKLEEILVSLATGSISIIEALDILGGKKNE